MRTYQLDAKAFIDGNLQRAGYRFQLPDDVRPPHGAVSGGRGQTIDKPLVSEVIEQPYIDNEGKPQVRAVPVPIEKWNKK